MGTAADDLARRLDAELLVIGRATPPLSMKSVGAASKVRTVYHAGPYLLLFSNSGISTCGTGLAAIQSGSTRGSGGAAIAVERGASSWSTGPASSSRGQTLSVDLVDDRIGKRRESSEPVNALMLRCFHEEYDPRSRHAGGDGEICADRSMVMQFVAALYPHSSTALPNVHRVPTVSYIDSVAGQRLSSGLLFATRVVNALLFFNIGLPVRPHASVCEERESLAQACGAMIKATDPSSSTAAANIVMLSSTTENMARLEDVAPTCISCTNRHHLDGAPPTALCWTVLDRVFHVSTVQFGKAATDIVGGPAHALIRILGGDLGATQCGASPKSCPDPWNGRSKIWRHNKFLGAARCTTKTLKLMRVRPSPQHGRHCNTTYRRLWERATPPSYTDEITVST